MVKLRFSRRAPSLVPIFEEQFVQNIYLFIYLVQFINLYNMVTKILCKKENHLIKAQEKIEKKHILQFCFFFVIFVLMRSPLYIDHEEPCSVQKSLYSHGIDVKTLGEGERACQWSFFWGKGFWVDP